MAKVRIKKRVNDSAVERIIERVSDICNEGAKVVCAFIELHEIPTISDVLESVQNIDFFVETMKKRKANEYENLPPLVADCVREQIENKIKKTTRSNSWREINAAPLHEPYILFNSDFSLRINYDVITEHCTQYIEDKSELKAYERHKAAAEALNAFFGGEVPMNNINAFFSFEGGRIVPNVERTNYEMFAFD